MVIFTLTSFFINFCTCLLLSILLITHGKKYRQFTLFNINLCIWSISSILFLTADNVYDAFFYAKIAGASIVLIPHIFFRTAQSLSNYKIKPLYNAIDTIIAFTLSLFMLTNIMITGVEPLLDFRFVPKTTWLIYIYCIYLITVAIYGWNGNTFSDTKVEQIS